MTRYRYRAIGAGGEMLKGVSEGDSETEIAAHLQRRGAIVLAVLPENRRLSFLTADFGSGGRLRRGELTEATRELASMLGAGQDIDTALRLMTDEAPNKRIGTILGRVRKGSAKVRRLLLRCRANLEASLASTSV